MSQQAEQRDLHLSSLKDVLTMFGFGFVVWFFVCSVLFGFGLFFSGGAVVFVGVFVVWGFLNYFLFG